MWPFKRRHAETQRETALATATPSGGGLYSEQAVDRLLAFLTLYPDRDEALARYGITRADLRAIEADDEVTQTLETRRDAVIGTPWRLEPNQARAAKWLTAELTPHIDRLLRGAWSAVPYGYSVLETVYVRRDGGRTGIASITEKPLEWFSPQPDGSLRYFPPDGGGSVNGIECDPRKFLLTVRNQTYRLPMGDALLARLWPVVTVRRAGWNAWCGFLEAFQQPLIVAQSNQPAVVKAALEAQFYRNVLALPAVDTASEKVTAINASSPGEFERFENAIVRRVQKLILGQTLTSGTDGGSGNRALGQVHDGVRTDKRNSDLRLVGATAQKLVNALAALNGWEAPCFVLADNTGLERERADRDAVVAEKLGWRPTLEYMLDRYDYDEGDIEPAPSATPPVPLAADAAQPPAAGAQDAHARAGHMVALAASPAAGSGPFTPAQTAADGITVAAAGSAVDPLPLDALRAAVLGARDLDDLDARLASVLDRSAPEFTELLARADFAARVLGYVAAVERRA